MFDLLLDIDLPETMRFLNAGWWVFHLVVIPTIFLAGLALGKRTRSEDAVTTGRERVALPGSPGYRT